MDPHIWTVLVLGRNVPRVRVLGRYYELGRAQRNNHDIDVAITVFWVPLEVDGE